MSFFEQPLDDATVNKFFAGMPRDAMYLGAMGDNRIFEIVRAATGDRIFDLMLGATADHRIVEPMRDAGPEMVNLARGFYVWSKRKRQTSKARNRTLRSVQKALLDLATALDTLRADLELRVDEGEPSASTAWPSSTSIMAGPTSTSMTARFSSSSTLLTPNTFPPRLEPEALRRSAKLYGPGRWGPNKGGTKGEAWAFAALVSVLAQQYERETRQPAQPIGAFLGRVRTEISRVERVHSKDALRKRVAHALEKRAAWTSGVISSPSRSPVSAVQE